MLSKKLQFILFFSIIIILFNTTVILAQELKKQDSIDILQKITFRPGGAINFKQDSTLTLKRSMGWIWSLIPKGINLDSYTLLKIEYKTNENAQIFLELKNKKGSLELPIVGESRYNNVWKIKIKLPNSNSKTKLLSINLEKYKRPKVKDKVAKIIAFSDPKGSIEITSMIFCKK